MSPQRRLILLVALACLVCAGETPVLTPAEAADLDRIYERAVQAGMPDASGGTLVLGRVLVSRPIRDEPGRVGNPGNRPAGADGRSSDADDGVHLRCADGRWLLRINTLVTPTAANGVTITAAGAKEPAPADFAQQFLAMRFVQEQFPQDALDRFLGWLAESDRSRVAAAEASAGHLLYVLSLSGSDFDPLWLLHLRRLGVPEADRLILLAAACHGMPWWWTDPETPPLSLDNRCWRGPQPRRSDTAPGSVRVPDMAGVVSPAIRSWFREMLLDEQALTANGLDPERLAAAIIDLTPASEQDVQRPLVRLLLARRAVPLLASDDADFATRLQSWCPGFPSAGDHPSYEENDLERMRDRIDQLQAEARTRTAHPPAAADIPALIALLEDPRPTRWVEGTTPRTLGDNALRALTRIVGFDVRLLTGRPLAVAWTDAERSATAAALRALMQRSAGRSLAETLEADIGSQPAETAIALIGHCAPERKSSLLDTLAAAWAAQAPAGQPPEDIATLLRLGEDNGRIAAAVRGWKVEGPLRPVLACWRNRHGDPDPLERMFGDYAALAPARPELAGAVREYLQTPSPQRLQQLAVLAAGPVDDPRTWAPLLAVASAESRAVRLAIASLYLADQRPLPDGWVRLQGGYDSGKSWQVLVAGAEVPVQLERGIGITPDPTAPLVMIPTPSGLRMRDIAALLLVGMKDVHELVAAIPDPWSPPATREQPALEALNAAARAALVDEHLPDVVPALRADGKGLF